MFVRVKKIKGRPYAYLVENEWTPWGSRQRVTKYLGKTHTLNRLSETAVTLPPGLAESVLLAVKQELANHAFVEKDGVLVNDLDIVVDLSQKTVRERGKTVVLGMNEGYLCDHTLTQLLAFTPAERPDESAKKLANLVLEAGLRLNSEQFLHLYEQVKSP